MLEPKKDIYTILSEIEGAVAYQSRPDIDMELPCFIFYISGNLPVYVLEKAISHQEVEVTIDIFGKTSVESGSLLTLLESAMLGEGYRLTYCSDIPDDNTSHITTRFNLVGY